MSQWQQLEISGVRVDVFEPEGAIRFGLMFLRDYEQTSPVGNAHFFRLLQEHRLACAAPVAGRTFWTERRGDGFHATMSASQHVVEHCLPWMLSRWALGPRGVAIAGEGIGGQGALRLSFLHPNLFPVVAAIAPSVEFQEWYNADTPLQEMYDSKEQCRQDTASLHIHPTEFPPHIFFCSNRAQPHWWRGGDRLHEKLAALGIGHTVDLQSRADQPRDYFERMWPAAMRFLIGGLEKESRRLV